MNSFYVGRTKVIVDSHVAIKGLGFEWRGRWKQLVLRFWFRDVTIWWRGE